MNYSSTGLGAFSFRMRTSMAEFFFYEVGRRLRREDDAADVQWDFSSVLEVMSEYGSPVPGVGQHTFTCGASIEPQVDATVELDGVRHTCVGWSMLGNQPGMGVSHHTNDIISGVPHYYTIWVSPDEGGTWVKPE